MEFSQLYSRAYYLSDCHGYQEFQKSHGTQLPRRLAKCLALAQIQPGVRLVDLGCGRGELALQAASHGAVTLAVDPSPHALRLVAEALSSWAEPPKRIHLLRAQGENLPIASDWADVVVLSDVVEHIPDRGLGQLLDECRRILRPLGRLVIHTQPNRILLDYTVPLLSRISRLWGVDLPCDLRDELSEGYGRQYHPNEQSFASVRRLLRRRGFTIQELWLEGSYPIHRIFGEWRWKSTLLARFRKHQALKELFASQIFAVATK